MTNPVVKAGDIVVVKNSTGAFPDGLQGTVLEHCPPIAEVSFQGMIRCVHNWELVKSFKFKLHDNVKVLTIEEPNYQHLVGEIGKVHAITVDEEEKVSIIVQVKNVRIYCSEKLNRCKLFDDSYDIVADGTVEIS